ncbi:MAG: M15 family metallopeptidase [Nonlabens sp.]
MRHIVLLILMVTFSQAQIPVAELIGKSTNTKNSLLPQVEKAFLKMQAAAKKEGILLTIVSGYRSFDRQRLIWNRKWEKYERQGLSPEAVFDKIVEYSTVPGTSRHHWGTDIDLIDGAVKVDGDVLIPSKFHGEGSFCKMKEWMDVNASSYGFELVYTLDASRPGFNYEPWHYSYVPLSRKQYQDYLSSIDLNQLLKKEDIKGLNTISKERIDRYLREHIMGINPILK